MSIRTILTCLAATSFGTVQAAQAQPSLPDGPGKAVVETACLGCHEPIRISNAGYPIFLQLFQRLMDKRDGM